MGTLISYQAVIACCALEIPFHLTSKCAPRTIATLAILNMSLSPIFEGAQPDRASTSNILLDDHSSQKSHAQRTWVPQPNFASLSKAAFNCMAQKTIEVLPYTVGAYVPSQENTK